MRSIWLRARLDTAPRFCGLEIGNAVPHHRQRGIPKGGRTPSHTPLPTPSERVTDRLAVRLALQAVENRVYLSEPVLRVSVSLYITHRAPGPRRSAGVEITRTSEPHGGNRKGQGSGLHKISDRKIVARWLRRCSQPGRVRMILEFCVFSMGSAFRAIGRSPTRNAQMNEN